MAVFLSVSAKIKIYYHFLFLFEGFAFAGFFEFPLLKYISCNEKSNHKKAPAFAGAGLSNTAYVGEISENAQIEHCIGNFEEAGNIGAFYIIYISVGCCAVFYALFVDVLHDLVQAHINLFR